MSHQVGKAYRKHRGAVAVFALVVVAASLVIAVYPAGAATVTPTRINTGGQNNDCAFVGSTAPKSFRIVNPVSGDFTDPATGTTFHLTVTGGTKLDFTIIGGSVGDVVVKGGADSNWYDYDKTSNVPVLSNTGLTAPKKSGNTTYAISHTTFCYTELTVTPSCEEPFSGIRFGGDVQYSAQLQFANGTCKTDDVIMYTYVNGNDHFATLYPPTAGGAQYRVIEHLHWRAFGFYGGNANPAALWYDDTGPTYGDVKTPLPQCKSDPRTDPSVDPFALPASFTADGSVLPGTNTSCLLQSTDSAPAIGDPDQSRVYDAWLFSKVDGARGYPLG